MLFFQQNCSIEFQTPAPPPPSHTHFPFRFSVVLLWLKKYFTFIIIIYLWSHTKYRLLYGGLSKKKS